MPYIRFSLELAIPEDVYRNIPGHKKSAFKESVKQLKALSVRVGEEMTVKATWHKCNHDINQPCEEEKEI